MRRIVMLGAAIMAACASDTSAVGSAPTSGAPSISSITPDTFAPTTDLQLMTINGSGFASDAYVVFTPAHDAVFQGTASRLLHISSSQLIYKFNSGGDSGTWSVKVLLVDGRGSNPQTFSVR